MFFCFSQTHLRYIQLVSMLGAAVATSGYVATMIGVIFQLMGGRITMVIPLYPSKSFPLRPQWYSSLLERTRGHDFFTLEIWLCTQTLKHLILKADKNRVVWHHPASSCHPTTGHAFLSIATGYRQ